MPPERSRPAAAVHRAASFHLTRCEQRAGKDRHSAGDEEAFEDFEGHSRSRHPLGEVGAWVHCVFALGMVHRQLVVALGPRPALQSADVLGERCPPSRMGC